MTTIMVDDTDGSIVYSGSWSPVQNSGAYAGSLHQTASVNSSASLTFTGTSINIYGTIPACVNPTPTAYWISMRLANDTSADTNAPLFVSGLLPCAPQPLNNVLFYSAETLSNEARVVGIHNFQDGFPLAVDFFSYVSEHAVVVSSSLVNSQTIKTMPATVTLPSTISAIGSTVFETVTVPTTIDGQATSVIVVIPTVIAEASITPSSTGSSKDATGRIVGGVVTSILGFFILLSFLFHWRRRRLLRRHIKRTNDSLDNVHLSGQEQGFRGAAVAPTMTIVQDRPPVLPSFPTPTSPTESSASDTPYSSTDVSHGSRFTDSLSLSTVAIIQHRHHPHHAETSSERGVISTTSNSPNTFPSPLPLDEKRTSPYLLQWSPSSEPLLSPEAVPPTPSSASQHSHSSPLLRQSFLNRPVSSIAPSEAAPAYYSRDPNTGNRLHYRSGMSTLTTATESIPPAYDAEQAPPLPPLPISASGFGSEPSWPASVESIPRP